MAFTEFCCRSGGSNLNAGTLRGDSTEPGVSASFTYASGSWVQSTGVFTVASGDPATAGVAVGDFASVYPDAAMVTPFVGRITAVSSTTITVSLSAKAGTAPINGTTDTTIKVGGAWKGPNGAEAFPFSLGVLDSLLNSAQSPPRINLKNDAIFQVTSTITSRSAFTDIVTVQGYSGTYGDLGRATISGGVTGASYVLFNIVYTHRIIDLVFQNNGGTGSATGVQILGAINSGQMLRCSISGMTGTGLEATGTIQECEVYGCNGSGVIVSNDCVLIRCVLHSNLGNGVYSGGSDSPTLISCICYSNGAHGWYGTIPHNARLIGCEFYDNVGSGALFDYRAGKLHVENCNFVANGQYGVSPNGKSGIINLLNCGFGSGTMSNVLGSKQAGNYDEAGTVTYPADTTPWVDPANGDFRINLAEAKGAGRGTYTQTEAGQAGTIGYPDIGAAQAAGGVAAIHPLGGA